MSAETELYREVVVEHKRAPRNFGQLPHPTHQARGRNPSCGDEINVQLQVDDGHIHDIRFDGVGCAICIASASLMTEAIKGDTVSSALDLQRHFRSAMTGREDVDEDVLGKLISLQAVRNYPSRIKCALLGWHALAHALNDSGSDTTI
ncbi:MAG: SUF system NifU family Fe-S cluster assembly protein [Ottowia sp.]|nr:SUF system NifU family Fe-S cluster assembly protein [Ottowia sp.]